MSSVGVSCLPIYKIFLWPCVNFSVDKDPRSFCKCISFNFHKIILQRDVLVNPFFYLYWCFIFISSMALYDLWHCTPQCVTIFFMFDNCHELKTITYDILDEAVYSFPTLF